MSEEKREQAISARLECEEKGWARREEIIKVVLETTDNSKTNAIAICERAEQDSPAIEQEQALSTMVKGMERDNQQERGNNDKTDPRD